MEQLWLGASGEGVIISDKNEGIVIVLQLRPLFDGAQIITQMQFTSWLNAGNKSFHNYILGEKSKFARKVMGACILVQTPNWVSEQHEDLAPPCIRGSFGQCSP